MDSHSSRRDGEAVTTKEARRGNPSGVLYLFQHDSVPLLVDALLDLPPNREVNKSEFADHAGVTRQTVGKYVEVLLDAEIVEVVPNTTPPRYRLADSEVVAELFELNSALNSTVEPTDSR